MPRRQLRYRSAAYEGERTLLVGVGRACNLLMPLGAAILLVGCVIGVANWL